MIVRGMNESKVVVFILSTHFYNSAACKKELSLAYQKGKVTIPVRAEDVAVSEEFEWYLTGLHRVEALTPLVDQHFDELVEAVRSKIESPRHEAPAGQNTEDTEATIASFDKAPGIDPRNALAWNRMGFSLNYLGQYDEAIASFDKALAIDLRNHAALNRKQEAFNALAKKR
jgi:tetratricopeptide (TPR) repeat protein